MKKHQHTLVAPLLGLLLLAAVACGGAAKGANDVDNDIPDPPAAGRCLPDVPDCVDVIDDGNGPGEVDPIREDVRVYLGMNESDLPDHVRVARVGDEHFMLTEDYVLGRVTVELDDIDGSGNRVVSVTVELPDGPETFELGAG
jgi:hypothetical protein